MFMLLDWLIALYNSVEVDVGQSVFTNLAEAVNMASVNSERGNSL